MGRLGFLTDAVFFIKNLDKEGQKFLRQRIILIKRIWTEGQKTGVHENKISIATLRFTDFICLIFICLKF